MIRALVGCDEPCTAKELAARADRRVSTTDTGLAWLGILHWVLRSDRWRHSEPVRVYELTEQGRIDADRLLTAWDGDG